jgi:hypothetical protein
MMCMLSIICRPRYRTGVWWLCLALAAGTVIMTIGCVTATGKASAANPIRLNVEASRPSVGWHERSISYVVNASAGPMGAQFGLALERSMWPAASGRVVGSPVTVSHVVLDGPGVLRAPPSTPEPLPVLIHENRCKREAPSMAGSEWWVELPAETEAHVMVGARLAYPRWPGTLFVVEFSTFGIESNEASTIAPRVPFGVVESRLKGPTGTHVSLEFVHRRQHHRLAKHEIPRLVGKTNPPLRHRLIALRVVRPTETGAVSLSSWKSSAVARLGTVRTDSHGRFKISPHAKLAPGHYALLARSSSAANIVSDWNCGPFFTIRK